MMRSIIKICKQVTRMFLADTHTSIPAQVVSYDPVNNTCSVQPVVMKVRAGNAKNLEPLKIPQCDDIPVKQRGSGKLLATVAPQVGSYGLYHVSERCIEGWILNGGIVKPSSIRMHHISDGVFDPGMYPLAVDGDNGQVEESIKTDRISLRTRSGLTEISVLDDETIIINNENGSLTLDSSGNLNITSGAININGGADAAALASKVDGIMTKLDTLFRTTWTPVAPDGGAALKTAYLVAFATPPAATSSTVLKVDA